MRPNNKLPGVVRLVALLCAFAAIAAACGDDDDTGTEEEATEAPAEEEATGPPGLADAQAIVEQYLQRPTTVPITEPVGAEIPEGLRLYFITCGVPVCEKEGDIIKEATDILGWEMTKLSTDGTPASITNAWDQAVREEPDVVLYTAFARSQIESQITALAENGTFISSCCHTDPAENGIGYVVSTPDQTGELGEIMAAWVVADAAGASPGVVYLDLPEFAILSTLATQFEASLGEFCPDCAFDKVDFALADLGSAADQVVSYLRSNPDTKYVVMSTDSAFSLTAAIEAAGLEGIRVFGEGPGEANIADMFAGTQAASMYFDFYGFMFSMVDAAARDAAGVPQVDSVSPVPWIVTADNIPTDDPAEIFPAVEDVVGQFSALWGKT